jgi:hypothetical protein
MATMELARAFTTEVVDSTAHFMEEAVSAEAGSITAVRFGSVATPRS